MGPTTSNEAARDETSHSQEPIPGEIPMAHGERAAAKSNHRGDYWGRRRGNESCCNSRGPTRRGLSPKTVTHRLERRDSKRCSQQEHMAAMKQVF